MFAAETHWCIGQVVIIQKRLSLRAVLARKQQMLKRFHRALLLQPLVIHLLPIKCMINDSRLLNNV